MDYMLERERIAVSETIYDGSQECPVDLEASLPDYCPDIQRILKCQINPRITSRSIAGDRLMIDGNYRVTVCYLPPEGNSVRFFTADDAFSTEIALKQQAENSLVFASPRVEYVNCRASGPRRLNIHGSFSLCAKVVRAGQEDAVCGIDGDDVEQRKTPVTLNQLVGFSQQQFSVDEVLESSQGKPVADSVIRTQTFVELQESKIAAGKLMTKGEIKIRVVYLSAGENSTIASDDFSIPFTQMLDCDGAAEDCICCVRLSVTGVDAQIRNDSSGESSYFDVQVKVGAIVQAYRKVDFQLVDDAYSRKYDLCINSKQKILENYSESVTDTFSVRSDISLEENTAANVTDIWSEMASASASVESGKITAKGKFNLGILAEDEKGMPIYLERLVDFEHVMACSSSGDLNCAAEAAVKSVSGRISGKGIEVKAELVLSVELSQKLTFREISEVTADESKPAVRDDAASLCLYYASEGESIWNIARAYHTSAEAVREENGISGDSAEGGGLLMIPM